MSAVPLGIRGPFALALVLGALSAAVAQESIPEPAALRSQFTEQVRPLLQTYCIRCHGAEEQSGGLRLDDLSPDITAATGPIWTEVRNRLDVGTMPKKGEPRPSREEQSLILQWIGDSLKRHDADHQESGGDTLIRRINHRAYANMIQTLLGVPAQGMDAFPPDGAAYGFATVGSGLSTTVALYQSYLTCAQRTLELALSTSPSSPKVVDLHDNTKQLVTRQFQNDLLAVQKAQQALAADPRVYAKLGDRTLGSLKRLPAIEQRVVRLAASACYALKSFDEVLAKHPAWAEDPRCADAIAAALKEEEQRTARKLETVSDFQPFWSGDALPPDFFGLEFPFKTVDPGQYQIAIRLCLSDAGQPLPLCILVDDRTLDRFMVYEPQSAPRTWEATVILAPGSHKIALRPFPQFGQFVDYVNATYGARHSTAEYHNAGGCNYEGATLLTNILCGGMTVHGPLAGSWPTPAAARILTRGAQAAPTREYAEEIVTSFMKRAYSRDCSAGMVQPYVDLIMAHYDAKKDFVAAVTYALSGILSSPQFLYLDEGRRADPSRREPLPPYALARRLAYFLWSDLPDEALAASAASGALASEQELLAQLRRMLADPRSRAFREGFTGQWLRIDRLDSLQVDLDLFPTFDAALLDAAEQESVAFFSELLDRNLSLANFIDSDFAMVNARLAAHYGIPGVVGNELRRVQLPPGSHRGGVLGQASVLIATGNGMVTSVVRRGVLVMERLLGVAIDPPPPNVPALPAAKDDGTPLTQRERLAQHRAVQSCARCHDRIDPLGGGLENFDAIGAWKAKLVLLLPERTRKGKPQWVEREADVHGALPDGTTYDGPDELRRRLLEHRAEFVRSFAENLAIYALGRGLELSDRPVLDRICARLAASGDGLGTLVEEIVLSELFKNK